MLFALASMANAEPFDDLQREAPALARLLTEYPAYREGMAKYAHQQGFRMPYENLATVVHETIHIASALHQGYFIDGVYYEPYVDSKHWPTLRNRDVAPAMFAHERGVIHQVYMRTTPENNLGNILDEVNAYSHVLGFVCRHEPSSAGKQIVNLLGHLNVVEAYLRVTRTQRPDEYAALARNRLSAGALATITSRAWSALSACGQTPGQVPKAEAEYFNQLRK